MPSRRDFLGRFAVGSVAAPAALTDGWQRVLEDATRFIDRRAPRDVARDED